MLARTALLPALLLAAFLLPLRSARAVDPGSTLIGCDQADTQVTISETSHLDPSCIWTRGVQIVASDVTLDCQGAQIVGPTRRYGVYIVAPTDVALSNVTVRNCHIDGFLNGVHVEREGFRDLPEGQEYETLFSDIVIEDSAVQNTRGVGIFVNGYVTGVTLRRLRIENTGSAGIYLETGSRDNVVEDNTIVNNGYKENGPDGQFFELAGVTFWFWGPGREGIAIDGSRNNVVRNNYFAGNSAGGIFLYKNCGEYPERDRYFERRYGAHGNRIEGNRFVGEDNGVWVASRMGENTLPMNCTDPEYAPGYRLDYAKDNVIRGNTFENVTYGIRVEDDRTTIEDNAFVSDDAAHVAILVGTPLRTKVLGLPVEGSSITGNRATIQGSKNPYRWVDGQANTTFANNRSFDRPVGLCEGAEPARGPFVMAVAFVVADPDDPPTGDDPVLPPPDPLPPCPIACEAGASVTSAKLVVKHLGTPPGDDKLVLRGRVTLPHPFDPPLDPVATGVGVLIEDATGAAVLDMLLPGGDYDGCLRAGWKALRNGVGWKYVNQGDAPPGGLRTVVIRDRSRRDPGAVVFRVSGKNGSYPVAAAGLPLTAVFSVDPPTAETGQCAETAFTGATGACAHDGNRVICR
jgi:parallel beta-helix repeat protein